MSRGLGRLQRAVMDIVTDPAVDWVHRLAIATAVFGPVWTETQQHALARAIRTLKQRGLVVGEGGGWVRVARQDGD